MVTLACCRGNKLGLCKFYFSFNFEIIVEPGEVAEQCLGGPVCPSSAPQGWHPHRMHSQAPGPCDHMAAAGPCACVPCCAVRVEPPPQPRSRRALTPEISLHRSFSSHATPQLWVSTAMWLAFLPQHNSLVEGSVVCINSSFLSIAE